MNTALEAHMIRVPALNNLDVEEVMLEHPTSANSNLAGVVVNGTEAILAAKF